MKKNITIRLNRSNKYIQPIDTRFFYNKTLTLEEKGLLTNFQLDNFSSEYLYEDFDHIKELVFNLDKKGAIHIQRKHSSDNILVIKLFEDDENVLVIFTDAIEDMPN